MDPSEVSEGSPAGHSRNASHARRQAMPRRTTRGPLDSEVDPLSVTATPSPQHLSVLPRQSGSPSRSLSRSPGRGAPMNAHRKNFAFLLRPDNFHPLNDNDVPPPFRDPITIEPSEQILSKAIADGKFRTAAALAAELLKSKSDPSDSVNIFALLHARLVCLQLSGLERFAAQESKALQDLMAPIYRDEATKRNVVPWALRVIAVRLQALGFGDWRRAIMTYYDLAREARFECRRTKGEEHDLWSKRLQDIGVRTANALVDMGDLDGAIRFLRALPQPDSPEIMSRLALVCWVTGDVVRARQCITPAAEGGHQQLLDALCSMADGKLDHALEKLQALQTQARGQSSPVIAQNLAACLVYTGRVQEAKIVLEDQVEAGSFSPDMLFNLATIFELCSDKSREQKTALAVRISKQKPDSMGWERANADFKF